MVWTSVSIRLWSNLRFATQIIPYFYGEIDRKLNPNTKTRKLKESDPDLAQDLTGKVCVITGGTRGLGAEVVKTLLRKNCHIITASSAKSADEREKRYQKLRSDVPEDKGKLEILYMDLEIMDSVVEFAEKIKSRNLGINYLIANAAVMYRPVTLTAEGFEQHLGVNYLSHCLLVDKLIDNLYETGRQSGSESRIVLVSSAFHRLAFINFDDLMFESTSVSPNFAYSQSKLAIIMFAMRVNRWLEGKNWQRFVTINTLHPGLCDTQLLSHLPAVDSLFRPMASMAIIRSAKEGSETTIYATISSEMNGISGKYLEDCAVQSPSNEALNGDDQNRLWQITWKLVSKWTDHEWS